MRERRRIRPRGAALRNGIAGLAILAAAAAAMTLLESAPGPSGSGLARSSPEAQPRLAATDAPVSR